MMNMRSICGPFFGLKGTSHVTLFDEVSKLSSCNVFTCTRMNLKCYMCCFFFPVLDLKVLKYVVSPLIVINYYPVDKCKENQSH